ncbi:phosphatase [Vararia minispora EC-137]|uniref:Phosphatase n=1 Tax=Vararia minispora EC-137 TaxID=1314806 RepID=A0ACB8QJ31_9AGAM|nr:phosphatase [Vararia minispora EC-137]
MPSSSHIFDAVLFDMDGTLVDSTAGVVGAWEEFAQMYPNVKVQMQDILSAHGVRTVENLRKYCGVTDPDELEREAERFEKAIVTSSVKDGRQGIVLLPGVRSIIDNLSPYAKMPNARWTICTSATRSYASAALEIAGIEKPETSVFAEDVESGKPAPDPYLLGLVVEDAPAGIRSGQAAGCKTLGVITSHSREQMEAVSPNFLVPNLQSVTMKITEAGVVLTIEVP